MNALLKALIIFLVSLNTGHAQLLPGLTEGYVQNKEVNIHYVTGGEGPLVVLLHGFPDYWYTWRDVIPALTANFKIVAIDLRGYNKSDKPEGVDNYKFRELIGDVAAVIKHFGKEKAILIGHDWGAALAWNVSFYRPELVDKLVALNIPHPATLTRELAKKAKENEGKTYASQFLEQGQAYSPEGLSAWVKDEDARKFYRKAFARSDVGAMLNYYKANFPSGKQLTQPATNQPKTTLTTKVPVLLIFGLKDAYIPKASLNDVWDLVDQDLTLVTIPSAGHFVQQDAPELVRKSIYSWLLRDRQND